MLNDKFYKNELKKININKAQIKCNPIEYSYKQQLIDGYYELANNMGPYNFMMTFELSKPVNEKTCIDSMSFLLRTVQKKLYSKANIKHNNCFSGISVAERHKKSLYKYNCFHFHNLIKINKHVSNKHSIELIESAFNEAKYKLINIDKHFNSYQISADVNAINIIPIDEQDDAIGYCFKEIGNLNIGRDTKLGFIHSKGVDEYLPVIDFRH